MTRFFGVKRVWPWLLLFLLAFSVFFTRLWLNQFLEIKTVELKQAADKMGITLHELRLVNLPPSLRLSSIEIPVKGKVLSLVEPALVLELFPPCLYFSARLLGGKVNAEALVELGALPRISQVNFNVDNLRLSELMSLGSLDSFAEADSGNLSGSGKIAFKAKNSVLNWDSAEGAANFNLKNGSLMLKLPLLRENRISDIRGDFHLRMQGAALELVSCRMAASPVFFEAQGRAAPWFYPGKARLQLNTELRIPADLITPGLVPERTMAMIRQKGLVRTKIEGSLVSPKIYLEN